MNSNGKKPLFRLVDFIPPSGGNFEKNVLEQDCLYQVYHNT